MDVKLSALDVVPAFPGQTAKEAIDRAVEVAQGLEQLGWARYLVAEHHNTHTTLSSATAIIIERILSRTEQIQVGAGGVMLSNHTPLQVAETYGTLDVLYPGRVDLGLGRAPGTDPAAASMLIRRDYADLNTFAQDVALILHFFDEEENQVQVAAYPGVGADVHPLILGSSLAGAQVAAALGLPYAFAAHINPRALKEAAEIYRSRFAPSRYLEKPYLIICVWLYASETAQQANAAFEAGGKQFLDAIYGRQNNGEPLSSADKILLKQNLGLTFMGGPAEIKSQWTQLLDAVHPDELMAASLIPDASSILQGCRILDSVVRG